MKITTLTLAAVTFVAGCACTCRAETTEEMVSACRAISTAKVVNGQVDLPQDFDSGVCWGAFATIQTVITLVDPGTLKPVLHVCATTQSTRTQLIQIFLVYAQAHPERYQEDYFPVALTAISKAFPCPAS
jgi:Rap1a immunity proteins